MIHMKLYKFCTSNPLHGIDARVRQTLFSGHSCKVLHLLLVQNVIGCVALELPSTIRRSSESTTPICLGKDRGSGSTRSLRADANPPWLRIPTALSCSCKWLCRKL